VTDELIIVLWALGMGLIGLIGLAMLILGLEMYKLLKEKIK